MGEIGTVSAIRKRKGRAARGGLSRSALRARAKVPFGKRGAHTDPQDAEKIVSATGRRTEVPGTAITDDRSLDAVDLSRLSIILLAGGTLGFLLSPLSPFAWAHDHGLFVIAGIPVAVALVALVRTARG